MKQEQWKTLNWMSRTQIKRILEGYGFAVEEWETLSSMKNALVSGIRDGSIDASVLEEWE